MTQRTPDRIDLAAAVYNRAGQPALSYRVLRYDTSVRRMIERLHRLALPDGPFAETRPLARLTTRQKADPTIALIDAWAMVIDILAFYQERIANEGYLRTASEQQSVIELLRAIGYELRPNIAANTFVLFEVEDAPGAPRKSFCPKGTQVQSVPASDELPQTFETLADLTARVDWNELRPQLTAPQLVRANSTALLLPAAAREVGIRQSDVLYHPGLGQLFTVTRVTADDEARLVVELRPLAMSAVVADPRQLSGILLKTRSAALFDEILAGTFSDGELTAIVARYGISLEELPELVRKAERERAGELLVLFRDARGFFGQQAPSYQSLPQGPSGTGGYAPLPPYQDSTKSWSDAAGQNVRPIWKDCFGDKYLAKLGDLDVLLDSATPFAAPGGLALFHDHRTAVLYRIDGARELSVAGYGLSGQVSGLKVSGPAYPELLTRDSTALLGSECVPTEREAPLRDDALLDQPSLRLDRLVLGLLPGQLLCLSGEPVEAPFSTAHELVTLTAVRHVNGHTELGISGLSRRYRLASVTLSANVVFVNHGETVASEVLGSGDGSQKNQRFELSQTGLMYQATASEIGMASALSLTVNDVPWREVAMLYEAEATDTVYTLRADHEGRTTVVFGDGVHGARLPSGQDNLVATYRKGGGPDGEVKAGSLQLLVSPPLGIRAARNPLPASGSADRETVEQAKQRAPLSIRPLSRLVSRRDYEDFARTFGGIEKASAVLLSAPFGPLLHLTVAASSGRPLPADSLTLQNLARSLRSLGDPAQPLCVQDHLPLRFRVRALLRRDPDYPASRIEEEARARFSERFSFLSRELGQPVMAAEVLSALQTVPGVRAVTLLALHDEGESPRVRSELRPSSARIDADGARRPAELLLADGSNLFLEVL